LAVQHIHTFLVHPGKATGKTKIVGTTVSLAGGMFDLLNGISAYSRYFLRVWTPSELSAEGTTSTDPKEVNNPIRIRAREKRTFSRRWPCLRLMGPNRCFTAVPPGSRPYVIEMKMKSRSSPCTFSRFLTKNSSPPVQHLVEVEVDQRVVSAQAVELLPDQFALLEIDGDDNGVISLTLAPV